MGEWIHTLVRLRWSGAFRLYEGKLPTSRQYSEWQDDCVLAVDWMEG